jgi:hypothetical protein
MTSHAHQPRSLDSAAVRFAVDTTEAPLAWRVDRWPDPAATDLEVELIAHGMDVTMSLPVAWPGSGPASCSRP